jgi:hypothetical protein
MKRVVWIAAIFAGVVFAQTPVIRGTPGVVNQIPVFDGSGHLSGITVCASGVMITSAGNVPLCSTILTSGLTIPGYQASVTLPLSGANGGTGVNNGTATITLAGNLATTGAFNTTFAQGGTATVTLPATSQTIPGMNQVNMAGAAFTLDASGSTAANAVRVPVAAAATATANGAIDYDSTNDMLHAAQAGADAKIPQFTATPVNNDCAKWTVAGSKYKLDTTGAACAPQLHSIGFVIDGGGAVIATGALKDFPTAAFACTINRIDISADQSGSITVDVWKRAGAIPTSSNKISASAPLTLSSSQLSQNGSLTGWSTSVSSGDVFGFSVATATTVTHVVGQIWCS